MPNEISTMKLVERAVLEKFDGDVQDAEHLEEVIVIEDGVETDHWHKGDDRDAPRP